MRINKYLALKTNFSRREADRAIQNGRIKIGNKIAELGDRVNKEKVFINNKPIKIKDYVYLAFNKPKGIVTSGSHWNQKEIKDILRYPIKVHPVGRLDMDSTGLIILTNDPRVTNNLLGPNTNHEKEYIVSVNRPITNKFLDLMRGGVNIGGYITKFAKASKIGVKKFRIVLTEGKNRQIRKMCEVLDYKVQKLERVRILNIRLKNLQSGNYRELAGRELKTFLQKIAHP